MHNFFIHMDDHQLFVSTNYDSSEPFSRSPLIFLHDSWGCVDMWGDFPKKIQQLSNRPVLLYDRRGYGRSSDFSITQRTINYLHDEADVLIRLMDQCNIQEAILYGHSDGATIALIAAALYPQRIKGLLLEGPHSFIEESGKAAVRETRERAKSTTLLESLSKFHGDKTTELFRLWHETWLSDYFAPWTIVPLLKNINCPVLAFQGDNDEFGTIEQLTILQKEIQSKVTIAEIAKAAHTPRKEAELVTMSLIADFFRQLYK